MKKITLLLAVVAIAGMTAGSLTGCGNRTKKMVDTEQASDAVAVIEVDRLLSEADGSVDQTITFEGVCTHICKHGGKKMFIMGSDDTKTIRVESTDETGAFKPEVVNSVVRVKGILREQRIDEAYLVKWEQELKDAAGDAHAKEEAGCSAEQKAHNQTNNTIDGRIADYRARIAERKAAEGKDYLSFYYVDAIEYTIM